MQLRCYRCGWSFAIKRDEIEFALEALEGTEGGHHDVRCPRCRHTNKISLEQLQQASPRREVRAAATEDERAEAQTEDQPEADQSQESTAPS